MLPSASLSHNSRTFCRGLNLVGVVLGTIANVLPNQQAREECAETPLSLVLERNVWMLEISGFDVELLKDFAQPTDRRIALAATPATPCREAHRRSSSCWRL